MEDDATREMGLIRPQNSQQLGDATSDTPPEPGGRSPLLDPVTPVRGEDGTWAFGETWEPLGVARARQRERQDRLAEGRLRHEREMSAHRAVQAGERRRWIGLVLLGMAGFALIFTVALQVAHQESREQEIRVEIERQRQATAQECIKAGRVWVRDACVPLAVQR